MLTQLQYTVSNILMQEALDSIQSDDFRVTINQPTGTFFYDPWVIKKEYQNTPWEELYDSLPLSNKGEARIIHLRGGTCYSSHADVDDRYHLNLSGNKCFLIDLDNQKMHPVSADGHWYTMDAGRRHVAANFGNRPRYQMVVRQLMSNSTTATIPVEIHSVIDAEDARFLFDDQISSWLNQANKQGAIHDFRYSSQVVSFNLNVDLLEELKSLIPTGLTIK